MGMEDKIEVVAIVTVAMMMLGFYLTLMVQVWVPGKPGMILAFLPLPGGIAIAILSQFAPDAARKFMKWKNRHRDAAVAVLNDSGMCSEAYCPQRLNGKPCNDEYHERMKWII